MKNLLLIFILMFNQAAHAGAWIMKDTVEMVDSKDDIGRSVLRFSNRASKEVKVYAPVQHPWGFYKSKEITLDGKTTLVTSWAHGAESFYFRVFQPDVGADPVCEFETELDTAQIRMFEGHMQYLETTFQADDKKIAVWKFCPKPKAVSEKTPASVPAKKSEKIQSKIKKK